MATDTAAAALVARLREALEPCLKTRFEPDPSWGDAELADYWVRELVMCQSTVRTALSALESLSAPAADGEVERLREALAYYANEENYNDNGAPESGGVKAPSWSSHNGDFISPELDYGKTARAALKGEA